MRHPLDPRPLRTNLLVVLALAVSTVPAAWAQFPRTSAEFIHQNVAGITETGETDDFFGGRPTTGDFNGDGFLDLAISSHENSFPGFPGGLGIVYVIYGTTDGISVSAAKPAQKYTVTDLGDNLGALSEDYTAASFGAGLAAGDFNGDGFDDLAIGISEDEVDGLEDVGSVAVLWGRASGLRKGAAQIVQARDIPGLTSAEDDGLGTSLLAGDFDGDGFAELVLGMHRRTVGSAEAAGLVVILPGAAQGLLVNAPTFFQQGSNGVPGTAREATNFGYSLAAGHLNADSHLDLVVGAPVDLIAGKRSGSVTVIPGTAGGPSGSGSVRYSKATTGVDGAPQNNDAFGLAIAVGDLNLDGIDDLAVGAPLESSTGKEPDEFEDGRAFEGHYGAVYLFLGTQAKLNPASPSRLRPGVDMPGPDLEDGVFGFDLAFGDATGDGRQDLAVGAPFANTGIAGGTRAGKVWFFTAAGNGVDLASAQTWHQGKTGVPGTARIDDTFGAAVRLVDMDGNRSADLVIGALADRGGAENGGSLTILHSQDPPPCVPTGTRHCLQGGRFAVEVDWAAQGDSGPGRNVGGSDDSGLFWFFAPDNWEMVVKVLRGCPINQHFWVYAAATTNVAYNLRVTDTATGQQRLFSNQAGQAAQAIANTKAFQTCDANLEDLPTASQASVLDGPTEPQAHISVAEGIGEKTLKALQPTAQPGAPLAQTLANHSPCILGNNRLCLLDGRLEVTTNWETRQGTSGSGKKVNFGSSTSGLFWFFDQFNWEMLVKAVDACGFTGTYWVYGAATTDVGYTVQIRDTVTEKTLEFKNPIGNLARSFSNVQFFRCN